MEIEDGNAGGFWGLVLQPGKSYAQVVDAPYRISMAALGLNLPGDAKRTSVTVTIEKKQFVLCSLIPEKVEQVNLDHVFEEGANISFSAIGNCPVHLTGYYMPPEQFGDMDDDYDEDDFDDEEGLYDDEDGFDDDDDDDEDEDDDDEDDDEDDENGPKIVELDADEAVPQLTNGAQKRKANQAEAPQPKKQAVEAAGKPQAQKPQEQQKKGENKEQQKKGENKEQQKKGENKQQQQQQQQQDHKKKPEEKPKGEKKPEEKPKGEKKTLANGLVIEETKAGQGKVAKKGSTVFMRYTGRLASNNSVFDSNTSGAPFKFRLGAGEVIKGWDLGIEGMTVGSERRLTIPANLAYGAQGAPPAIPKNAKLVFDVKLLDVK